MKDRLRLSERLPVVGIGAFSLCSVWSLYHLFTARAHHPTWLYLLPAVLVEAVTAWTVYQTVEQVRRLTRSNLSRQDQRFYAIVTGAFVLVALPTLAVSTWANSIEFGNLLLGLLFPVASVGCAVGAALPQAVEGYRKDRARERQEAQQERKAKARERQKAQELDRLVSSLGNAGETLRLYADNPMLTQASVAQELGISRQAVGQHLARLQEQGLVRRNGNGVEVVL